MKKVFINCSCKNKNIELFKKTKEYNLDFIIYNFEPLNNSSLFKIKSKKLVKEKHIDFSKWIQKTLNKNDYIVLTIDMVGFEYKFLTKIIKDKTIEYINKIYIKWYSVNKLSNNNIYKRINKKLKSSELEYYPELEKIFKNKNLIKFDPDIFMISYPKAGRTWIRVMLAKLLQESGGYPKYKEIIRYRHPNPCFCGQNCKLDNKRVILLTRDPRDIIVSNFFQITLREHEKWKFKGCLSKFIRSKKFGIRSVINFYNYWFENKSNFKDFIIISYEDLKIDALVELKKICNFLKIDKEIGNINMEKIIEYSSFKNMQQMDMKKKNNLLSNEGSLGTNTSNPDKLKVRRGKVKGFVDYLNKEDIQYVNKQMINLKNNYFYNRRN